MNTQTSKEFETVCPGMNVVSVYGGTSISMQISELRRGADVVVGTPGRIIDLIERGSLSLDAVRVVCDSVCYRVHERAFFVKQWSFDLNFPMCVRPACYCC